MGLSEWLGGLHLGGGGNGRGELRMPRCGNPGSAVGGPNRGPTVPSGDARAPDWPRSSCLESPSVPPATCSPRSFGCARGRAGLAELRGSLSPGGGRGSPGAAEAPHGAWASLALAWPLCDFSAATFFSLFPQYTNSSETLCSCQSAFLAVGFLALLRIPGGRFYHQPRFRQERFHPNLWTSVKSSPEMRSRKEPCFGHPGYPLRCWHFPTEVASDHPGRPGAAKAEITATAGQAAHWAR